jgi:cobalamin biosynthesis protein CbiG
MKPENSGCTGSGCRRRAIRADIDHSTRAIAIMAITIVVRYIAVFYMASL